MSDPDATNPPEPQPCAAGGGLFALANNTPSTREGWSNVVSKILDQVYNSSAAAIPSPSHFYASDKTQPQKVASTPIQFAWTEVDGPARLAHRTGSSSFNDSKDEEPSLSFNSDHDEFFVYRRARGENIMFRLQKHFQISDVLIERLSTGVFSCQKTKPSTMSVTMKTPFKSPPSPPSTSIPSPLYSEASPPPNPITPETPEYIPYTYTIGLRNANPYKHRDILIRGRIPMWVQTVFLNTCLGHLHNAGPLHPNMDYVNLFHFAPYVQVTFREMTSDHMLRGVEPFPIVDMLFERLGFETEELSHDDDTIPYPPSPEKSTGTNEPDFSDFPPDIAIALNPWPPYCCIPSSVPTGRSTNPLGSKFPTVLWAEIDDEKARVVTEEAEKWMKTFERMMGAQVADGGFGLGGVETGISGESTLLATGMEGLDGTTFAGFGAGSGTGLDDGLEFGMINGFGVGNGIGAEALEGLGMGYTRVFD